MSKNKEKLSDFKTFFGYNLGGIFISLIGFFLIIGGIFKPNGWVLFLGIVFFITGIYLKWKARIRTRTHYIRKG